MPVQQRCCCPSDGCTPHTIFDGGAWPSSMQVEYSGNSPWTESTQPIGLHDVDSSRVSGGAFGPYAVHDGKFMTASTLSPRSYVPNFVADFADHSEVSPLSQSCWISSVLEDPGVPGIGCVVRYTFNGPANGMHFKRVYAVDPGGWDGAGNPPFFNVNPYHWTGSAWVANSWTPLEREDLVNTFAGLVTVIQLTSGRRILRVGCVTGPAIQGTTSWIDMGMGPADPSGVWSGAANMGRVWIDPSLPEPSPIWDCGGGAKLLAEADPYTQFSIAEGTVTVTGIP